MKIEQDDFDAWRDNSITQAFLRYLQSKGDEARERWVTASWNDGNSDPLLLADLRAVGHLVEDVLKIELKDIQDDEDDQK